MPERLGSIVSENNERLLTLPFSGNLQTPGGGVNLYTDLNDLQLGQEGKENVLEGMIPGWRVGAQPGEESASLFLLDHGERAFFFDEETMIASLLGRREDFMDGQAVGWISYWMMEAQRQGKSLFTLHASALTIANKGILLLGHSGSGKTSVMLDLCRKHNGEVLSNDLTIVGHDRSSGQMALVEGTRKIGLRLSSIAKNFPDLNYLFPAQAGSAWETKTVVTPEQIGLHSSSEPNTLDAIFEIHVDSKEQDPLLVQREDGIPIHYRMYEDMSRIVRGSAISVFGSTADFLGYMPSLDTESRQNNRVECINQMVKKNGVVSVSGGNLDEISETIYELISAN